MRDDLARLLSQPIAHRGLHGCGRAAPIENSIGAAQAAIAGGYGIECDVQLSRDGEAIVFHDEALSRLTGKPGLLADFDAALLETLVLKGSDDRVPTLGTFLGAIGGRVPLVIEIKSAGPDALRLTDRVLSLVADYPGAVAVESFDPAVIRRCRELGTRRPVGLVGPPEAQEAVDANAGGLSDFLSWSIRDLATAATRYPRVPLSTWTVRTPEDVACAKRHAAQIVFEGFVPSPSVNDVAKEDRGLSL